MKQNQVLSKGSFFNILTVFPGWSPKRKSCPVDEHDDGQKKREPSTDGGRNTLTMPKHKNIQKHMRHIGFNFSKLRRSMVVVPFTHFGNSRCLDFCNLGGKNPHTNHGVVTSIDLCTSLHSGFKAASN